MAGEKAVPESKHQNNGTSVASFAPCWSAVSLEHFDSVSRQIVHFFRPRFDGCDERLARFAFKSLDNSAICSSDKSLSSTKCANCSPCLPSDRKSPSVPPTPRWSRTWLSLELLWLCSWQKSSKHQCYFDKKGVDWAIRISPHYFNTIEEIDMVCEIIKSIWLNLLNT